MSAKSGSSGIPGKSQGNVCRLKNMRDKLGNSTNSGGNQANIREIASALKVIFGSILWTFIASFA